MSQLIDFIEQILSWLKDLLLWLPRKITELILDGLAALIEVIPVPDWLSNAPTFLAGIDPTIVYFVRGFALAEGLAIVFGAYVIRFLIRRIPVVG